MTGNARNGVTVTVSSSPNVLIRVMHISRGRPLISALHDPHLPALQFHRTARSPAWVACSRWMMSRTTSPSLTGTGKGCRSPPSASPGHPRDAASEVMPGTSCGRLLEDLGQVGRHLGEGLAGQRDRALSGAG